MRLVRDDGMIMSLRKLLVIGLVVTCALPVAVVTVAALRVHLFGRKAIANPHPRGRTAVVFGARAFSHGPSEALQTRLDHSLVLLKSGCVEAIAMAGGSADAGPGDDEKYDEVKVMINYAREHGAHVGDLLELRPGQNTREQVLATKKLVIDAGRGPVIAVSSSFHLARIADEARRCGFYVEPSAPAYTAEQDSTRAYLAYVVIDAIGTLWYALPPRFTTRLDDLLGHSRHLATTLLTGEQELQEPRHP